MTHTMPRNPTASRRGWRWTVLAAIVGFTASSLLSSLLHLPRGLFLLGYGVLTSAFVAAYVRAERLDVRTQLSRRWIAGVAGGVILGALLARQVLSQPASARAEGLTLAGHLAWYGVMYGIVDALLLSVIPVLALYGTRPPSELARPAARLEWGAVALLESTLVTSAYHLGFAEFRGSELIRPIIGTAVVTLGYLLTGNPLAAIISHVMMHCAAVIHGMATTMQLPPHY